MSNRGGFREGAGRPKGTGPYGENTTPIRVPRSVIAEVQKWLQIYKQTKNIIATYQLMVELHKEKQK